MSVSRKPWKCHASSNKKLVVTSATLVVRGALLVVTRFAIRNKGPCRDLMVGALKKERTMPQAAKLAAQPKKKEPKLSHTGLTRKPHPQPP